MAATTLCRQALFCENKAPRVMKICYNKKSFYKTDTTDRQINDIEGENE